MSSNKSLLLADKCRLCLNKAGIHNIFESNNLQETIEEILFVKVISKERLPQWICEFCLQTVTSAKELKVTANKNDAYLKSLFPLEQPAKPRIFVRTDLVKESINKTTASEESDTKLPISSPEKSSKLNNKESIVLKKNHYKNDDNNEYVCGSCEKVFTKWKKFYLHQRTHTKSVVCSKEGCGKKFATKGDLERHYRTHTGEKPYWCEICYIGFAQLVSLKMHNTRVHQLSADDKDSIAMETRQAKRARTRNLNDHVDDSSMTSTNKTESPPAVATMSEDAKSINELPTQSSETPKSTSPEVKETVTHSTTPQLMKFEEPSPLPIELIETGSTEPTVLSTIDFPPAESLECDSKLNLSATALHQDPFLLEKHCDGSQKERDEEPLDDEAQSLIPRGLQIFHEPKKDPSQEASVATIKSKVEEHSGEILGPDKWSGLSKGSEDESDEEPLDDEAQSLVPRSLRIFHEPKEDPSQEALVATIIPKVEEHEMFGPNLYDFDWKPFSSTSITPSMRREKFVGTCGPTRKPFFLAPTPNPYDVFIKIWDKPIMEHIAKQTNLLADRLLKEGRIEKYLSSVSFWQDTNANELYVYFALVTAMGVIVKSKIDDYWTTDKNIFSTPGFSATMTLKRFQFLSRCLHFNDDSNLPNDLTPGQNKIFKIQPIVDHLNSKFSSLYSLGQNIVVDESLTQWEGWLDSKLILNKASEGIKSYEVCDSRNGYLWRFEIHAGSECQTDTNSPIQAVTTEAIPNLVLRLLRGLERRGHTVWMDSYYNSPVLARVLKSLGFDCAGTLHTNRQYVPDEIDNLKNFDMRTGKVCGWTSGDVDLIVWRDNNRVALISTYHGHAVNDNKLILIKDYNDFMEGVDKKDQIISMYPMERKPVWYKKLFRRLLNVSIFNAYIIHKHFMKEIKHREFRMRLVTELLERHQQGTETSLVAVSGVTKFSAEVLAHFPAELPKLSGAGKQRRLCVFCKSKRIHNICNACNVTLCFNGINSCYIKYHS